MRTFLIGTTYVSINFALTNDLLLTYFSGSQSRVNLLRNQLLVKPNDERSVPEDILSSDSASLEATENKAVSETVSC